MSLEQLKDYNYWVGKTPKEILNEVRGIKGGWATVFPDKLPVWAHRVRNYLNREPKSLLRLPKEQAAIHLKHLETIHSPSGIAEKYALTGEVFRDAQNWMWYQMNEGGTIYHWGSNPKVPWLEAPWQEIKEKLGIPIPVFKLVAPDGTGGSRETILRNLYGTFVPVIKENFMAYVAHMTIEDYHPRGSYNYSETVEAGIDAHRLRDVAPHEKYDYPNVYIAPPSPYPFRLCRNVFSRQR